MLVELVLTVLLGCLIYQLLKPKVPAGFPPGPPSYPLVGGALFLNNLGKTACERLQKLGEIYGPITGIHLGKQLTVVINSYEVTKEIYSRDELSWRPHIFQFDYTWGGRQLGVFFSNGQLWKEQRRFALRHLRDFGFGKTSMEGLIHEEAEECIKSIKKALNESANAVTTMHDKFGVSVINILWAIVSGKRFSHDDEKFKNLLDVIQRSFRSGSSTGSLFADFRWLRHIPIVNKSFNDFLNGFHAVQNELKQTLAEHRKTRDPNYSRDFIDIYLKEMDEEQRKGVTDSTFFEDQLLATSADLFNAGAESTSNTVAFAVRFVLLHPEVQVKLHKELDKVVGRDRLPSFADKPNLHYVEAVMTESYRMSSIAPVSVPRSNSEATKLMGYHLPKGTFILINLQSIHMDKKYWGDPDVFRPERFLDQDGKFVKPERVLSFGSGRRACLGEPLARMSSFLLFSTVMQHFRLEMIPTQPKPSLDIVDGFTVAPTPFEAKLIPRK